MTLKEIVTLPAEAKLTHAIAGTLYYRITTDNIVVEFPITLMRYIRKAMENETLITIDKSKLK